VFEIVDVHTHVHPTAAAAAAFREQAGQSQLDLVGDLDDALATMDRLGIATIVLLPIVMAKSELETRVARIARTGAQPDQEAVRNEIAAEWSDYNAWSRQVAREYPGRFVALAGLDPVALGADWTRNEIERALAEGARGLKIAPGVIGCSPSDERMQVLWELADRHALTVLAQSGITHFPVGHPEHFEPVLSAYPRLKLILAHAGVGAEESTIALCKSYANVYVDTSVWFGVRTDPDSPLNRRQHRVAYSLADAAEYFRELGIDRVLFGTNYGIREPAPTLEAVMGMPLRDDERRRIFSENAREVFDLAA
jgi:predicted TIM-barrel fold metal-dependent hydrolase